MPQAGSAFPIHRVPLNPGEDPTDERPKGVVVVPAFEGDASAAMARYEAAAAAKGPVRFSRQTRLAALVLGPPQDEEDHCEVSELLSSRWEFEVRMARTSARAAGTRPERTNPWRALAVVPLSPELRPGDYSVHALWLTNSEGRRRRQAIQPYLTLSYEFEVTP